MLNIRNHDYMLITTTEYYFIIVCNFHIYATNQSLKNMRLVSYNMLCYCPHKVQCYLTSLALLTFHRVNLTFGMYYIIKVRKTTRIRNRYNQVPHLSQDTKWESKRIPINITINITNKSQEVSPFPSDDHKATMSRRKSMTITRHK